MNNLLNVDLKRKGTIVGVGYIFRSQKVFFTLNGKEVYQMRLPECMSGITKLFPTVSLGSLKDRIQLNFGEGKTQFRFDLASKVQVSLNYSLYTLQQIQARKKSLEVY